MRPRTTAVPSSVKISTSDAAAGCTYRVFGRVRARRCSLRRLSRPAEVSKSRPRKVFCISSLLMPKWCSFSCLGVGARIVVDARGCFIMRICTMTHRFLASLSPFDTSRLRAREILDQHRRFQAPLTLCRSFSSDIRSGARNILSTTSYML